MTTRQLFLAIAIFGASTVCAEEYVDRADANGDGFVSLYELRAAHYADPEFNKRIEQEFDLYDRDGDGLISEDERRAKRGETQEARTNSARSISRDDTRTQSQDEARFKSEDSYATGSNDNSEVETLEPLTLKRDIMRRDESGREAVNTNMASRETKQSAIRNNEALGRSESWIREIDADNSGGASIAELVASGDGKQWFSDDAFDAADRNGDGDLDAAELDGLIRSLERRHR